MSSTDATASADLEEGYQLVIIFQPRLSNRDRGSLSDSSLPGSDK